MSIHLNACPRCRGAVLETDPWDAETSFCINCGWRRPSIPADVLTQVKMHLGDAYIEERYTHTHIGTGKPPLSGWERVKRRRERERRMRQPVSAESNDDLEANEARVAIA